MARTIQKLIRPGKIAAGQENHLGCDDSNCCCFIKRCSGIKISLLRDEFHLFNGLLKIVAKAAIFNGTVFAHKAQAVKFSHNLLVFKFPFFTLMCSGKVSIRIKRASKFQQ